MKVWTPSHANMISRDNADTVSKRHSEHLTYYGATSADCEMMNVSPVPSWDRHFVGGCRYTLRINTYLGWKVYMLHTGCFASKPEYEASENVP